MCASVFAWLAVKGILMSKTFVAVFIIAAVLAMHAASGSPNGPPRQFTIAEHEPLHEKRMHLCMSDWVPGAICKCAVGEIDKENAAGKAVDMVGAIARCSRLLTDDEIGRIVIKAELKCYAQGHDSGNCDCIGRVMAQEFRGRTLAQVQSMMAYPVLLQDRVFAECAGPPVPNRSPPAGKSPPARGPSDRNSIPGLAAKSADEHVARALPD